MRFNVISRWICAGLLLNLVTAHAALNTEAIVQAGKFQCQEKSIVMAGTSGDTFKYATGYALGLSQRHTYPTINCIDVLRLGNKTKNTFLGHALLDQVSQIINFDAAEYATIQEITKIPNLRNRIVNLSSNTEDTKAEIKQASNSYVNFLNFNEQKIDENLESLLNYGPWLRQIIGLKSHPMAGLVSLDNPYNALKRLVDNGISPQWTDAYNRTGLHAYLENAATPSFQTIKWPRVFAMLEAAQKLGIVDSMNTPDIEGYSALHYLALYVASLEDRNDKIRGPLYIRRNFPIQSEIDGNKFAITNYLAVIAMGDQDAIKDFEALNKVSDLPQGRLGLSPLKMAMLTKNDVLVKRFIKRAEKLSKFDQEQIFSKKDYFGNDLMAYASGTGYLKETVQAFHGKGFKAQDKRLINASIATLVSQRDFNDYVMLSRSHNSVAELDQLIQFGVNNIDGFCSDPLTTFAYIATANLPARYLKICLSNNMEKRKALEYAIEYKLESVAWTLIQDGGLRTADWNKLSQLTEFENFLYRLTPQQKASFARIARASGISGADLDKTLRQIKIVSTDREQELLRSGRSLRDADTRLSLENALIHKAGEDTILALPWYGLNIDLKVDNENRDLLLSLATNKSLSSRLKIFTNLNINDQGENAAAQKEMTTALTDFARVTSSSLSVAFENAKITLDKFLGPNGKYNIKADRLSELLEKKQMQCMSGTDFIASLIATRTDLITKDTRAVAIYREGHVLPGYAVRTKGGLKIVGIESTVAGKGRMIVPLQNNKLPQNTLVTLLEDHMLVIALGNSLANAQQVKKDLLARAERELGIVQGNIVVGGNGGRSDLENNRSSLFGFGSPKTPTGSIARSQSDKVNFSGNGNGNSLPRELEVPEGAIFAGQVDCVNCAFEDEFDHEGSMSEALDLAKKISAYENIEAGYRKIETYDLAKLLAHVPQSTLQVLNKLDSNWYNTKDVTPYLGEDMCQVPTYLQNAMLELVKTDFQEENFVSYRKIPGNIDLSIYGTSQWYRQTQRNNGQKTIIASLDHQMSDDYGTFKKSTYPAKLFSKLNGQSLRLLTILNANFLQTTKDRRALVLPFSSGEHPRGTWTTWTPTFSTGSFSVSRRSFSIHGPHTQILTIYTLADGSVIGVVLKELWKNCDTAGAT